MSWRDIRPVAVGVPRRGDEVLLSRLRDEKADETFYRPIGGAVEFGELSDEALVREFREELSVEVEACDLLDTLEDTFTFHSAYCSDVPVHADPGVGAIRK
jgi:ADP-ribose pyrophosphatase YjhB (NUDIX family)